MLKTINVIKSSKIISKLRWGSLFEKSQYLLFNYKLNNFSFNFMEPSKQGKNKNKQNIIYLYNFATYNFPLPHRKYKDSRED